MRYVHHRLYDLSKDPEETQNLATDEDAYLALQKRLLVHLQESQKRRSRLELKTVEPDEETKERLRALGYVD